VKIFPIEADEMFRANSFDRGIGERTLRHGQVGCYPEVVPREGIALDDRLKELMQELGNAINESLSDSERIAEAIGEIRSAGFDVFLVLEATIGFNKRAEGLESGVPESEGAPLGDSEDNHVVWTSQDHKFLKALKIATEDE
jgi:hypothetical protein